MNNIFIYVYICTHIYLFIFFSGHIPLLYYVAFNNNSNSTDKILQKDERGVYASSSSRHNSNIHVKKRQSSGVFNENVRIPLRSSSFHLQNHSPLSPIHRSIHRNMNQPEGNVINVHDDIGNEVENEEKIEKEKKEIPIVVQKKAKSSFFTYTGEKVNVNGLSVCEEEDLEKLKKFENDGFKAPKVLPPLKLVK